VSLVNIDKLSIEIRWDDHKLNIIELITMRNECNEYDNIECS